MQTHTIALIRKYEVADQTMAFVFEKPKDFSFRAGQYVVMSLPEMTVPDNRAGKRSLSIASAPYENELVFAMRLTGSGFKQTLRAMEPGAVATITDAIGHFVLDESDRPVVFLIGGIGITPARSILRQAAFEKSKRLFVLFYSNRKPEDASFAQELQSLPELNYRCVDTLTDQTAAEQCEWQEERGRLCDPMVRKHLQGVETPLYYIVGSPVFARAMMEMLGAMGVEASDIKQDPFTGI